ncbi:putative type VII secretion system protein EccE [Nocardia nova SH22a]|uniref:Putative type VII secretion system protein EccE n=1 Tax=Nocardia nova SH22a TaxID=1415166 RepID=W5TB55_9NOCA|nr:type VII secretion protein EccE [Nocardia nova]AHH16422.1 putative type VII secretion system protein EccE [Nocardia nova SH22a]
MSGANIRVGTVEGGPIVTASVAASFVLVGLWVHAPLWVGPLVVVAMLAAVVVRVDGRTTVRWLLDWCVYRTGMRARARERARYREIRDVEVAAGVCGVHGDEATLVAMIQLAPNLDLPTVIGEKTLYTEDVVPIDTLVEMLDQYGIHVDIDIVTTGQRVRPASSYSLLYDQLIGTHPVVGERMTWLVVRLDQQRNLHTLSRRGPCEITGPKALATAAHRIASRLRERGISAHALPAEALREATRLLHAGVELTDLRERWGQLESPASGRCVTSFAIDWTRLDGADLDDCWTWNRGRTTVVVSLAGGALGPRGLVRYVGPPVTSAPADYLRRLGGRQSTALLATLPTGTSVSALPRDDTGNDLASSEVLAGLPITIGPNGQILGAISGRPQHALALPLFDPARYNPRRRTIDVHADLPVAQQIVLRAMVVGADVEVHSARPQRWSQLVSAVGDPSSLRLAGDAADGDPIGDSATSPATIAVFDQLTPRASAAPTTVTISDPGTSRRKSVDLAINQVTATSVDVSIPMRTVRVDLIEPRGETRYYDNPPPPMAAATGDGPVPAVPQLGGPVPVDKQGR